MKKFLALALTLTLALALSVTTFAVTDHAVGEYGKTGSVTDGVPSLPAEGKNYVMSIAVTSGQKQSRYAVDVEYDEMTLSITGETLTWNVNELKYESEGDGDLKDTWFGVKVINYSDKGVVVSSKITDTIDDGINVDFVAAKDATVSEGVTRTATLEDAIGKTPATAPFTQFAVRVYSASWEDALAHYADLLGSNNTRQDIASCTISITAAP